MSEQPAGAHGAGEIVNEFAISIDQVKNFEFRVRFDKEHYPELLMDEPPPLGADSAPSASRILAAAIGNCLSASLLFCAKKSRVEIGPIHTTVHVQIGRNERGRLRVQNVIVEIDPRLPEENRSRLARCLSIFEDFCTVTESIRQGIDVEVRVAGFPASTTQAS